MYNNKKEFGSWIYRDSSNSSSNVWKLMEFSLFAK